MSFSLVSLVSGARVVNCSTFAALTFLLYDYALTFADETKYFWKQRWSPVKALFLFNRYFGLVLLTFNTAVFMSPSLPETFCRGFHLWEINSLITVVITTEFVLMLRIYAVYLRSLKVLVALGVMFLIEIVATFVLANLWLPPAIPNISSILTGCPVDPQSSVGFVTWIPAIAVECILCFGMLWRARTYTGYVSDAFSIVIRDSIIYFIPIFATMLANCFISALCSPIFLELATSWATALPCALSSRLLLNMHRRYYSQVPSRTGRREDSVLTSVIMSQETVV